MEKLVGNIWYYFVNGEWCVAKGYFLEPVTYQSTIENWTKQDQAKYEALQ